MVQAKIPENKIADVMISESISEGPSLVVSLQNKTIQREGKIGKSTQTLHMAGLEKKIVALDVDGDSLDEIILRTIMVEHISALWLFKWNSEKNKFVIVPYTEEDSFITLPANARVTVDASGAISVAGKNDKKKTVYKWNGKQLKEQI